MNVFDGDPERLAWMGKTSKISLFRQRHGDVGTTPFKGDFPPSDSEFLQIFERAKTESLEKTGSVFMLMKHSLPGRPDKVLPFAELLNGKLIAFCRPPWRRGAGLY